MAANQVKTCTVAQCGKKFAYLYNPKTGRYVPVDWDSMTPEERQGYLMGEIIHYQRLNDMAPPGRKHLSHFETCTDPNQFSRKK